MIVRAAQADDHVALHFVVADALNEAAAVDVTTLKCFEIDGAAIFYVNCFTANTCREKDSDKGCCRSGDHLSQFMWDAVSTSGHPAGLSERPATTQREQREVGGLP